ncbi:MAG TPA: hypothetical protein PLU11_06685 [Chitinophagaceae bacterium]|nr:hypothetical protein [Chitinophagaceae bacterium]HPN58839.1 hypothetical protein [Chitinophagaceae bacterium]
MKRILLMAGLLLSLSGWSQQKDWKEYRDFYDLVVLILHPAEYGELNSVKDSANLLLEKAIAWQASPVPSRYKKAEQIKKGLIELTTFCRELQDAVIQKKDDEIISLLAIKTHNKFHAVSGRYML